MTKIAGVIHNSVVDGPGLRTTIFFSGCRRNCPGCHNPEAQSFDYGKEISEADIDKLIEEVISSGDAGITLSGGHPLEPENYKIAETIITTPIMINHKQQNLKSLYSRISPF